MEGLVDNKNIDGHWSMEYLCAYIATVHEKFRLTLTAVALFHHHHRDWLLHYQADLCH